MFVLSVIMFCGISLVHAEEVKTPGTKGYFILDMTCNGRDLVYPTGNAIEGSFTPEKECTFTDLVYLVNRLIDFMFYMSTILAALCFIWAGFLLLTGGGNSSKVTQAKAIFTNVLIGYIIILTAWLIVGFVTQTFMLRSDYSIINSTSTQK